LGTAHRGIVRDIIKERNFTVFAEIGVFKGRLIKRIFGSQKNREILKEYWAIDPWKLYPGHQPETEEGWDRLYEAVCKRMVLHKQLRVLKLTSVKAASLFPDKYFDFVYIDANHRYESVYADICAWLPKVKDGGILGGHDYNHKQVKQAISEVLGTIIQPRNREGKHGRVWIKNIE